MRIHLSVPTAALHSDLRQSLRLAMQLGVHGVQFDLRSEVTPGRFGETARRQLLHELSERGLTAGSAHFPLRSPLTEQDRQEERLAALRQAIEFAGRLKIRRMTIRPGTVPESETPEHALLAGLLNELALGANHHGVTLCLIPSGDSAETLKQLLNQVKSGPVSVDADLASWVLAGQSVTEELRALFGWIGHLEARDAARGYGSRGQETPIGRGEIDWDEVAGLLNEMAFTGWVNVSRREGADRFGDIQRGVQSLQNLFAGGLAGA